jgi:hypothetical protein
MVVVVLGDPLSPLCPPCPPVGAHETGPMRVLSPLHQVHRGEARAALLEAWGQGQGEPPL